MRQDVPDFNEQPKSISTRPHLQYLDGLRGAACLWVLGEHVYVFRDRDAAAAVIGPPLRYALNLTCNLLFSHAVFAVVAFIVLSGYVLTLPVLGTRGGPSGFHFSRYIKRRAKRILPPYYFALLLSIAIMRYLSLSGYSPAWSSAFPIASPAVLLSHALLLQNRSLAWMYKINGPMWSIAVEWQIYFLFPLILVPLWRKFGICTAVTIVVALACAVQTVAPAVL